MRRHLFNSSVCQNVQDIFSISLSLSHSPSPILALSLSHSPIHSLPLSFSFSLSFFLSLSLSFLLLLSLSLSFSLSLSLHNLFHPQISISSGVYKHTLCVYCRIPLTPAVYTVIHCTTLVHPLVQSLSSNWKTKGFTSTH